MGNILSALVSSMLFCYLKLASKLKSGFSDDKDYSNSQSEGLLNNEKFETINIRTSSSSNNKYSTPGNNKNEYQLLKNNEDVEYKSDVVNTELEQLQKEIKSVNFDFQNEKLEVSNKKEGEYEKENDDNGNINKDEEESFDDLKSHILNDHHLI